jgi:hypothetical protein
MTVVGHGDGLSMAISWPKCSPKTGTIGRGL